jgi:DNA-binding GntR family transcriptional regulator
MKGEERMDPLDIRSGKVTLADLAYEAILRAIFSHELMPGDSLRAKDLAGRFGISTTPIERALEHLAGEGLVEFVPGRGPRVSVPNVDEILDLYDARQMIELYSVERGFDNADGAFLERMLDLIKLHETTFADLEANADIQLKVLSADTDIHKHLISLWPNPTLHQWYQRLHVHTKSYQLAFIPNYRRKEALQEHKEIYQALNERNLRSTLEAVRNHNEQTRLSFIERLKIVGVIPQRG